MKYLVSKAGTLCVSLALALTTGTVQVAQAQETAAADEALEEVVVTGSRIRQSPLEESSPILQISEQDIDRSGLTSIGDYLQRLSASGGALNTRFNSSGNFGFPPDGGGIGAGASQVDLRFLGSKRTLVLVDGVRWVNGSSASGVSSAVDLNTIPTGIIDRIEVLEDGASSIYGSDAISGVVNIITKKDFDGFEISAYTGAYDEGDGETQEYSISLGSVTDRSSTFLNIGFTDSQEIRARDRRQSSTPIPFVTTGQGGSSGTPQGRFFFNDPNTGTDVDCTINDGVIGMPFYDPLDPCGAGDDFHPFTTADRFNFSQFNLVLTPSERTNIYGQAQYDIADNVQFYAKALFNNRQSKNQAAPEPLFIGSDAGNGNLMDTISIDVTNPYNPFGFSINAEDQLYFMGRRPIEGGPRIFEQNVDTFYVGGGFTGEFEAADRPFYWDINFATSQNRADQIKRGGYNSARLKRALGPIADCTGDCVPFNFFGGQGNGDGTITQDMLDYVGFIQKDVSEQELFLATANITGDLFEMPAGMLAFAAGLEHRELDGFFQPDSVVTAGETAGVPSSPTSGAIDIDEFYLELEIPILADAPGAELLDFNLAFRSSDSSTFGSDTTTKFGVRYRPVSNFLIRASVAEGLRDPGIGELFGSSARFDQTLDDPCSDFNGTVPGNVPADAATIANCIALGVPGDGSYVQTNPQISVTTGGNPDLVPEEADSTMIGLVWDANFAENVDWIESLSFEATYYDHEVDGAIQALDAEVQLAGCVATLDPGLCNAISRTGSGVINGFSNQLTNIGGIETSGYDLTIKYESPELSAGTLSLTWQTTVLDKYTAIIPTSTGFVDVNLEGTETGDPEQAYPEMKSSIIAELFRNNWAVSSTLRYIDSVTESCAGLGLDGLGLCSNEPAETNSIDSTIYLDLQGTWRPSALDEQLTLTLGINNVLDEDPPACFSCALNGFDATTHDVPGVFWYARATWRSE
ncbi:MAG: TonB-dependent receptor [Gammaproteobacteria bacterium]|nr:TonB-dependent receptor [Gammaproteobacteria bacterium]